MFTKTIFGVVGAVAALGAGGTAYAASTPSTPPPSTSPPSTPPPSTPPPSASPPSTPLAAHRRSLLARTDHASFEVKVKGQWVTYDLDRGRVTAVSPTSITLARPDGQSVTEALTPTTRYRGVTAESQIRTGQPAGVISDGGTALVVRQKAPATSAG